MECSRVLFILGICLSTIAAHPYYIGWAEPDSDVYAYGNELFSTPSRQQSLERLTALRSVMEAWGVTAYIVPTADAHNSQYLAPCDARRQWLSGLSGSAGTAVVTSSQALLWTDGRYFTQFDMEVNTTYWKLMRQGTDLSIQSWLTLNLSPGDVAGADPTTYTHSDWVSLQTALTQANIVLKALPDNLVDIARTTINDPSPPRPNNPLIVHTIEFSGKQSSEKISDLLTETQSRGASALVLTSLDEIAYTLNLRGTDIPYNPVFFAYLVIRTDVSAPNNVILFWGGGTLPSEISSHLTSERTQLTVMPYADVFAYLTNQLPPGSTIWLSDEASHAIYTSTESDSGDIRVVTSLSPVALTKCVKNDVELDGFHSALIKDSTAIVRFLYWLHQTIDKGAHIITEIDVVDKLEEFRGEEQYFMGPSFSTIAGAGENGAVIHYSPSREDQRVLSKQDMLLVDSGGQYRDGTTDITRTRHLNATPSDAQRRAFTRVLQGQINLGTAVFPKGTVGHTLETLARKSLWDVGLNYGHGTGHGVGHYLKVHEGPSWILSGPSAGDPGIVPGMIFSNEPGYYEVNKYGIRHEDMIEVIAITKDADHIRAKDMVGDFDGVGALGFRAISLVPHQTACLDVDLMTDFEIKYLNDYHETVLNTIGPILQSRNLNEEYEFLKKECAPIERIERSAAILVKSAPFLTVFVFVLRHLIFW